MSDAGFSETVDAMQDHVARSEITAGTMMRNAREAAGLHVAALAVSMKIPVKKLEALEADRLDLLHDAVFVRALAGSVCRALKIDPAPILNKLPLNATPKLNPVERGINAPFHSPNDATGLAISELLTRPSTLIVLTLVVAGIAVFFLPDIKLPDWYGELSNQATKSSGGANPSPTVQPSAEVIEASPVPITIPSSTGGASSSFSAPRTPNEALVFPPASVAAFSTETPVAKALAAASMPAVAASHPFSGPDSPTTGMVVFKAKGSTWVKVVDAKGIVQLSKTIMDGEVVGASGSVPLSVVIGRVDVTDVEVRGKPFVLTGVSKDNVARFEVK